MAATTTTLEMPRGWRAVLTAFLPLTEEPDLPVLPGERPAFRAQCRRGEHVWRKPEDSLRSARTGFTVLFCRYCMAHERIVPVRTTGPSRAISLPVPR